MLGNHDFYRGSIAEVREKVRTLCSVTPNLHWLPDAGVVPFTDEACLIGHDGWGDGRLGDVLLDTMSAAQDRHMTVLCGHTHGGGEAQLLPNLRVLTGGARYGQPAVQQVLTLA